MKQIKTNPRALICLVPLLAALAPTTSPGAFAAEFYKGRTITLIVASGAGAGYHAYASLLAKHIGRHISGNPAIVLRNMSGQGGLQAINYIYNVAPRDGTILAGVRRRTPLQELLQTRGVRFRSAELSWIGSLDHEVGICTTWKSTNVASIETLRSTSLRVGVTGPKYIGSLPTILNDTLGTRFEIIPDYATSSAVAAAMERGEVNAMCSSYGSQKQRNPHWFTENKVNVLVQLAEKPHPELPEVPLALDLAKDIIAHAVLKAYIDAHEAGRPYLAPPKVPAKRLQELRRAFLSTTRDSRFLAEAKQRSLSINPLSGQEVTAIIEKITDTQQWIRTRLSNIMDGRTRDKP